MGDRMDIFHINKAVKSYKYPTAKILIFVLLIFLLIYRGQIVHINNKIVDAVIGVLCAIVGIGCIFCIYISICEIIEVNDKRKITNTAACDAIEKCKVCAIEEVVSLVNSNDIIEIRIVSKGKIFEIGSSSDCKNGSSKFFDKHFYAEKNEFTSLESFQEAIQVYSDSGKISILSIDGVFPK